MKGAYDDDNAITGRRFVRDRHRGSLPSPARHREVYYQHEDTCHRHARFARICLAPAWQPHTDCLRSNDRPRRSPPRPLPSRSLPPRRPTLDRLLAPIALYPDQLLAQMLMCAPNPGKVAALDQWLKASKAERHASFRMPPSRPGSSRASWRWSLFPQVVDEMADQLDVDDAARPGVHGRSDRGLRQHSAAASKARDVGTLKSTPQQEVETKTTSSGQQVIVIEPANPQVVYVPQYNPQVVYTSGSSTVVVQEDDDTDAAVAAGMIGFTAGIAIGAAMDNNYYYGPYGWHGGGYMYNDAWDDYYDHREDAREDWQDHREDLADERGDRAENTQEQRTDRQHAPRSSAPTASRRGSRKPGAQAQREQRRTEAQTAASGQDGGTSQEARGYRRRQRRRQRPGGAARSDAFSGYSSGKSERAPVTRTEQPSSSRCARRRRRRGRR